ncbi:MAG: PilZ domain-containing protein [Candidatus Omnitrophica bacterium]|nr:PilZ domain-containing protein [Candidatus Omnitrophota bacterium]
MTKPRDKIAERRGFIRLRKPINITYTIAGQDKIHNVTAKDISADGIRFQTTDKNISEGNTIETKLDIPEVVNPVHAKGRIMWKKKLSLEDNAPFDIGVEFTEIEEDNKNTFLKFLCDLIYNLPEEMKNAKHKKN